jgi:acetoacetate decarboxylase
MLITGYEADSEALAEVLPQGLEPHPNHVVQMNMYEIDAANTSGFGAFSLTYLTVELDGHDSYAADGTMPIPGRFFAYYWNSSPRVISYAREAAGIPAMPGVRTTSIENDVLTSRLSIEGQPVITATANVTDKAIGTLGGHLNYYAHRQFPTVDGGRTVVDELVELPLPFVADLFDAEVASVEFAFPESHPASHLAPVSPSAIHSVLYGDVTFTYSMGRVIHDYRQTEPS